MKSIKHRALSLFLVFITIFEFCGCSAEASEIMRNMTTAEIVRDMGLGINLGNTLESCGDWIQGKTVTNYETAWGSPVITEDMIKGYKNAGFDTLRVPVAWSNLMNDKYDIDPGYMDRVDEIVGWAINADMYVILNIHWDGGWWEKFPTEKNECMKKYERIWTQICERFYKYSDKLIFESLNEEGGWDSVWNRYSGGTDGKKESYDLLNEINQKFVDIVRKSKGNNKKRHLLIAGYGTDIALTCDELFKMPDDPKNRCAVSVHYYTPSTFAILEKDADWGKCRKTWGTDADLKELDRYMDMMKANFVDKGIPVIIGEYGCPQKNKEKASIHKYITSVAAAAYERDMCPVLWDVTNAFYNRNKAEFIDKELLAGLMKVKKNKRDAA
ncbi:MAG: glycoside hydrolase family 5 protein [Oscillospiraceae bacterium]|nr:glycoside hydrolase family 5 protein [Oscillospiraceae bacterium]